MSAHSPTRHRSVALVTGGARGIGAALGACLAARQTRVILADVDIDKARDTAAAIGPNARAVALDVTDANAFADTIADVLDHEGRLDLLINNAGVAWLGEVRDMTAEDWDAVLAVNLGGVVHGVRAVYPAMVEQGHGHICNIACVAGLTPVPMATAYTTAKHAVVGFSTSLRGEAAGHGVEVSVVCPGAVATSLFRRTSAVGFDREQLARAMPSDRWLISAERCAALILRGIDRNRAVITVTRHARLAWLLYRLMPATALRLGTRFAREARQRFGIIK